VIADDHPIIRESLKRLFKLESDFEIAGEARDGREVLNQLSETGADVLLLDLRMPHLDGFAVLERLRNAHSSMRVIVLTASEDPVDFARARALGCHAVIQKQIGLNRIADCIRAVSTGETWPGQPETVSAASDGSKAQRRSRLTGREREIAALVARGHKNKEIAQKLFITEQTVKNHLRTIYQKLGVPGRLEVALYALQQGLDLRG